MRRARRPFPRQTSKPDRRPVRFVIIRLRRILEPVSPILGLPELKTELAPFVTEAISLAACREEQWVATTFLAGHEKNRS